MCSGTLYLVSMSVLNSNVRVEAGSGGSQSFGLTASAMTIQPCLSYNTELLVNLRREAAFSEWPLGDRIIPYMILLPLQQS